MNGAPLAQQTTLAGPNGEPVVVSQSGGIISGLQDSCSRHSGFALGLIVVLLIVILYLLAYQYGWLGSLSQSQGGTSHTKKATSRQSKSGRPAAKGSSGSGSDEIDDLIAEIESPI